MSSKVAYATTGDGVHIAYATWGSGDLMHVFLPEFGASVDGLGHHPAHIRWERFIGSLSRCACFDPRCIGGSDPVDLKRLARLEDWGSDLLAVVDALDAERVVITGEGYSTRRALVRGGPP